MRRPRGYVGESYVVNRTIAAAKKAGFLARKMVYQNRVGCPDNFFFGPMGRLIIIEFKALGKKPQPHQQREIDRLLELGFDVRVIDNAADGEAVFRGRNSDDLL